MVHFGEGPELLVPVSAEKFLLDQFEQPGEVPLVTILQEWIEQHRTDRGRERDGEPRIHPLPQPAIHDLDQGKVAFGDGFKEPVLFQKPFVLRMAHVRQMGVQN